VQRRHNCSPAASFANSVMTLYLLKVHLLTFLSILVTQKFQILSCDTLVANERYIYIYRYLCTLPVEKPVRYKIILHKVKIMWSYNFYVKELSKRSILWAGDSSPCLRGMNSVEVVSRYDVSSHTREMCFLSTVTGA